jgi:A/G-specific adenine glycosylase
MLQQTQVETVIPYYERFLRRFPSLEALSRAPLIAVLDSWSGLGYYSRAKNLHAGAIQVVRERGGRIPDRPEDLTRLPGIGRTTAGAIASIAFDRPAPVLDGNVLRVLCRYFGIRQDPRRAAVQARLWGIAGQLVPENRPGDFNQALMDLGATLCLPRHPSCPACPIRSGCIARRNGWQERIPPARRQTPKKRVTYLCGILEQDGRVLLARRPLSGLLPGLWEFPGGEHRPGSSHAECLSRLLRERLGVQAEPGQPQAQVIQILSHRRLHLRALRCRWKGSPRPSCGYIALRWVAPGKLQALSLTAGMRRLAAQLYPAPCSR